MDDADADAALQKFFEEDALLEALQDAPDMEAQAEVFKVPKPSRPASTAAAVPDVVPDVVPPAPVAGELRRHRREERGTLEIEKPTSGARASRPERRKSGRSWTGTLLVICISLVIWLIILWLWSPSELWPEATNKDARPKAPAPAAAAIRLPSANATDAEAAPGARGGSVEVAWTSADVSGNATSADVSANRTEVTDGGMARRIRKGRRDRTGIGH
ncbi:unnamed protein product [Durusdinium trenchii]|uniref:Uncharacterized protein n=2 Tax=Durusdinium trenchii TaxID=1381693 RepID=A0ABP0RUP7_9DINO